MDGTERSDAPGRRHWSSCRVPRLRQSKGAISANDSHPSLPGTLTLRVSVAPGIIQNGHEPWSILPSETTAASTVQIVTAGGKEFPADPGQYGQHSRGDAADEEDPQPPRKP